MQSARLDPAYHSVMPGVAWPAIPAPAGMAMLAAQFQFDRSQWWSAEVMREAQFRQLRRLVAHAVERVPHYQGHLAICGLSDVACLSPQAFLDWPLLDKREIQSDADSFKAASIPSAHGELREVTTSGSTGEPLRATTSDAAVFVQHALVLRSQLWSGFDMCAKFAAIRATILRDEHPDWGPPTNAVFRTGPAVYNHIFADHGIQLDWLLRERPAYLLAHNTNLRALLERSRREARVPLGLRAVVGFGDMPDPDTRALAKSLWGAEFFDTYSASEVGAIAFECPEHHALHVQAEHIYLEILRQDGSHCEPGETGRVVITDLQNFAMPLIRYQLRDHATVGVPCPCGRGLPVLERIVGRSANLAVDPTGRTFFAHLNMAFWTDIAPIHQRQVVQITPGDLQVYFVAERDLTEEEIARLGAALRKALRYDYRIEFRRVPDIALSPGGKFDDFLSLLPPGKRGGL